MDKKALKSLLLNSIAKTGEKKKSGSSFSNSKDYIVMVVNWSEGLIHYASDSVKGILGYTPGDLTRKGMPFIISITHPEDSTANKHNLVKFLQRINRRNFDKEQFHIFFNRYRLKHARKSKGWVWVETHNIPFGYRDDGHPTLMLMFMKNLNMEKEKENFLWEEIFKREPSTKVIKNILGKYMLLCNDKPVRVSRTSKKVIQLFPFDTKEISEREKEIIHLIAKGYSTKKIAEILKISVFTAERHRKNLLVKFKVRNSAELIKEASKLFWLD